MEIPDIIFWSVGALMILFIIIFGIREIIKIRREEELKLNQKKE